jgi:hypothetical protein
MRGGVCCNSIIATAVSGDRWWGDTCDARIEVRWVMARA